MNLYSPCKRGHTNRYPSGNCVVCSKARAKAQYQASRGDTETRSLSRTRLRRWRRLPQPTREAPGVCECCGTAVSGGKYGAWYLDHDHKTGKFRGWLCAACNRGIGQLGDSIDGVKRALKYLCAAA